MSDENDSWLAGIGVNVSSIIDTVQETVGSAIDSTAGAVESAYDAAYGAVGNAYDAASDAVGSAYDTASSAAWTAYDEASDAVGNAYDAAAGAVGTAYDAASDVVGSAYDAASDLVGDAYDEASDMVGSAYDAASDVAGDAYDAASDMANDAYDVAADIGSAIASGASTALDWGNAAGKAIYDAESAAWDGAKSAYDAVTSAYDSVAPNFTKANEDLGNLVDMAEALAKKGNAKMVEEYGDVPVLGSLAKASAAVSDAMIDATGGVVKGVGDLTTMAGNAFFHPIDATASLAEGALDIAEHVPIAPGLNTMVKGIHGAVDIARGKEDGKYGKDFSELAENLLMNTQQDPDDPTNRSNTDVEFLAGIGGGKETWKEKPFEAATRTIANLVPMFLGDEGAGGAKPRPKGGPPVPEGPPTPRTVDPFGKTQVDPFGKTQPAIPAESPPRSGLPGPEPVDPLGNTQVDPFGRTQPERPAQGPKTDVDPPRRQPEIERPNAPAELTLEQLRHNEIEAGRAHHAAKQAAFQATQEFVQYRANKPNPGRGWAGDPAKWDPVVDAALEEQMWRTQDDAIAAMNKYEAAKKATRDAAGRAKGRRGGGGFPPPRK